MYIYLFLITVLSYFIKGLTGFGNTVIMAPLYAFHVSPTITSPIDLLFSVPTNLIITWKEKKHIDLRLVLPLGGLIILGNIPGMLFLKYMRVEGLKLVLGVVVAGIGLYRILSQNKTYRFNRWVLVVIGVLSGVLAGMYGIALPIVLYITQSVGNKNAFRANLCLVFLIDNFSRLVLYGTGGLLNAYAIRLALTLSPAVFLGLFLGINMSSKLKEKTANQVVHVILILSGLVLAITYFIEMIS